MLHIQHLEMLQINMAACIPTQKSVKWVFSTYHWVYHPTSQSQRALVSRSNLPRDPGRSSRWHPSGVEGTGERFDPTGHPADGTAERPWPQRCTSQGRPFGPSQGVAKGVTAGLQRTSQNPLNMEKAQGLISFAHGSITS